MTDSKTYTVRGAEVIVTASVYPSTIAIHITLDVAALDKGEPDHSAHQLINYVRPYLGPYETAGSVWWSKLHRKVMVRTGSQANRVITHALAKIDDAIQQALIDRDARKAHMTAVFP